MDSFTAQEAKERLAQLIRSATQDKSQFRITSNDGTVVVLPEETYENILVTLELLSTPGLMDHVDFQNIHEAEYISQASN